MIQAKTCFPLFNADSRSCLDVSKISLKGIMKIKNRRCLCMCLAEVKSKAVLWGRTRQQPCHVAECGSHNRGEERGRRRGKKAANVMEIPQQSHACFAALGDCWADSETTARLCPLSENGIEEIWEWQTAERRKIQTRVQEENWMIFSLL